MRPHLPDGGAFVIFAGLRTSRPAPAMPRRIRSTPISRTSLAGPTPGPRTTGTPAGVRLGFLESVSIGQRVGATP